MGARANRSVAFSSASISADILIVLGNHSITVPRSSSSFLFSLSTCLYLVFHCLSFPFSCLSKISCSNLMYTLISFSIVGNIATARCLFSEAGSLLMFASFANQVLKFLLMRWL